MIPMLTNETINQNIKSFYIGVMITSVVGGILLLFTNFAGWSYYSYYYGYTIYGSVGVQLDDPLSIILFLIVAGCLFYCSYISYLGFSDQTVSFTLINRAFLLSAGALAVVVIGALVFIIDEISSDNWWWLEAGFYGGFIGSLLSTVFLYQIRKVTAR